MSDSLQPHGLQPARLLSMGFSRQEYWSGFPCPPSGDLPTLGIEPLSLASPALAGRFFTTSTTCMYLLEKNMHINGPWQLLKPMLLKSQLYISYRLCFSGGLWLIQRNTEQHHLPDEGAGFLLKAVEIPTAYHPGMRSDNEDVEKQVLGWAVGVNTKARQCPELHGHWHNEGGWGCL